MGRPRGTISCHPDRSHYARGLCSICYHQQPDRLEAAKQRSKNWCLQNRDLRKGQRAKNGEARKNTVRAYGISLEDYKTLLGFQSGVCAICKSPPKNRNLDIDHSHVPGFKRLPAEEKRKLVRGLLCMRCNRFRVASNTGENFIAVLQYLSNPPAKKALR